jgi:hypothetical protein
VRVDEAARILRKAEGEQPKQILRVPSSAGRTTGSDGRAIFAMMMEARSFRSPQLARGPFCAKALALVEGDGSGVARRHLEPDAGGAREAAERDLQEPPADARALLLREDVEAVQAHRAIVAAVRGSGGNRPALPLGHKESGVRLSHLSRQPRPVCQALTISSTFSGPKIGS